MESTGLRIGELADRTGLSVRTLRYYEEIGVLPAPRRLAGGHRVYGEGDVRLAQRVRLLRHVGVPLAEIPAALTPGQGAGDGAGEGTSEGTAAELAETLDARLRVLDERLAAMRRLRERVRALGEGLRSDPAVLDQDLLDLVDGLGEMDPTLSQRVTLLVYDDIDAVHDQLVTVFGFGPGRLERDGTGRVVHGELHVGDGVVWLHRSTPEHGLASPQSLGAATHCMAVLVDDVDAHHRRAVDAGAEIVSGPRDESYGYREYDARDLEGGLWSFMSVLGPDSGS